MTAAVSSGACGRSGNCVWCVLQKKVSKVIQACFKLIFVKIKIYPILCLDPHILVFFLVRVRVDPGVDSSYLDFFDWFTQLLMTTLTYPCRERFLIESRRSSTRSCALNWKIGRLHIGLFKQKWAPYQNFELLHNYSTRTQHRVYTLSQWHSDQPKDYTSQSTIRFKSYESLWGRLV